MTCLLCVQMPTRVCVNAHGQKPKFISLVGMSADALCVTLDHVFVYACVCVCVLATFNVYLEAKHGGGF